MAQTANYNLEKPSTAKNVDEEFYQLQETLDLLDSILAALQTAVNGKSATGHTHAISDVVNLAAELAAKMPASQTFKLDDLTDVSGADGAPNNYVLVKSALGWLPSSALAALGTHGHLISEITGLVDALAGKAELLSSGVSDNTFADTSEIGYVDGTTQKRGTFAGLISSLFNGTRALSSAIFSAASFKLRNAGGFDLLFSTTALTANRTLTLPDADTNLGRLNNLLGYDQTWQDVRTSRTYDTWYQNTTGRPIQVVMNLATSSSGRSVRVSPDNGVTQIPLYPISTTASNQNVSFIVPAGIYYAAIGGTITINNWTELR